MRLELGETGQELGGRTNGRFPPSHAPDPPVRYRPGPAVRYAPKSVVCARIAPCYKTDAQRAVIETHCRGDWNAAMFKTNIHGLAGVVYG